MLTDSLGPSLTGDLFVVTLRSKTLIGIRLNRAGQVARIEKCFAADYTTESYGRLKEVLEGPDGALTNKKR
jgi:glucose/arabinose dehydrogenase